MGAVPPMCKPLVLAAATLALASAGPALGAAAAKPKVPVNVTSRHLWATVDACNTARLPRVVGIRGSMPGTGVKTEKMYMRFQVQYLDAADWKQIPAADTGFRLVGSATFKARQSGQNFTIPVAATPYVLRGVVSFQWRLRGRVVIKSMLPTTAGHLATAGADPAGYSAAACMLPAAPAKSSGGGSGSGSP